MSVLTQLDGQLWQWCDMSYAQNQTLCLELQNSFFVNVNLLLFAHYLDTAHDGATVQYSSEQWQQLTLSINDWDERFLTPYRRLRKLAKINLSELEYQQMLDVELMMERKAQRIILNTANTLMPEGNQANLVSYLGQFGIGEADIESLGLQNL